MTLGPQVPVSRTDQRGQVGRNGQRVLEGVVAEVRLRIDREPKLLGESPVEVRPLGTGPDPGDAELVSEEITRSQPVRVGEGVGAAHQDLQRRVHEPFDAEFGWHLVSRDGAERRVQGPGEDRVAGFGGVVLPESNGV